MRGKRVFVILKAQRAEGPLSVRDISRIAAVFDPAVMDYRLTATRQVQHFGAATVLRVEIRGFNSSAVILGALFTA